MKLSSDITAIVTGGASGLGEATARGLAAKGVKVGIFDMNEKLGQAVADDIGGVFTKVDVSSNDSVDQGFDFIRAANGQERIMINCAGIGGAMKTASRKRDTGEIIAHDPALFARIININLIGSFLCASKSAAGMMSLEPTAPDGERGVVLNTASVAAQDGQIGQVAYAASKGGLVALTRSIARFYGKDGITAFDVAPGFTRTEMAQQFIDQYGEDYAKQGIALNDLTTPEDIAPIIVFLASGLAKHATGTTIDVNAGSYVH